MPTGNQEGWTKDPMIGKKELKNRSNNLTFRS